jgi:uncharacterized protein (TIGR03083 family)
MHGDLAQAIDGWQRDTATILAAVRDLDAAVWQLPSANPGWSNKDILVHLATGYVQRLTLLEGIVARGAVGPLPDADHANAARIAEHRDTPVEQLIALLIATRAEVLALLRQVPDEQLALTVPVNGRAVRLGDYVRDLSRHDLDHLSDLLPASRAATP